MTLENEVCDSLDVLCYPKMDVIQNDVSLLTDLNTFSEIVSWISAQLQRIDGFESLINPISNDEELTAFKIELNSCLRELNSPFIDSSVSSDTNKLSILNYLCGELLSSRMNRVNGKSGSNGSMAISMNESETAKDLKTILITLGMGKPPNNISSNILFKKIKDKLSERLTQQKVSIEDSLLLPEGLTLSPQQWIALQSINDELFNDYTLRREMLLRRIDCTVKSFTWKSGQNEGSRTFGQNEINEVYIKERQLLSNEPNVSLADALAARQSDCDALTNTVISQSHANCVIELPETKEKANKGIQQRLQLHKYIIGSVPDRGGRPNEQPAPSKESFSQQQQQRGRGRGGPGGGGRGGAQGSGGGVRYQEQNQQRIQGSGWAQSNDNQMQSRGGHRDQRNYNNQSGHQRYSGRDDYQQKSGHQQHQQQYNANYQQQYTAQNIQPYSHQQQYDKQESNYNYSDQSYYGNNSRQQYQQPSDHYNEQRDRNYNRGYRRGGGGGGRR